MIYWRRRGKERANVIIWCLMIVGRSQIFLCLTSILPPRVFLLRPPCIAKGRCSSWTRLCSRMKNTAANVVDRDTMGDVFLSLSCPSKRRSWLCHSTVPTLTISNRAAAGEGITTSTDQRRWVAVYRSMKPISTLTRAQLPLPVALAAR